MAATRKLQGEIDRCLKKVTEGVETFEDIWQKVHNATNSNQKEKYEADLKKEIKKLQRLRDQIKSWIASGEIKDKSTLLDYRKLIETQMERFKVVERETKTKAYSKEGLGAAQKLDPAQKEREEIVGWLVSSIDALNLQIDQFESEIESLLAGKKKRLDKDKQDRMEELKQKLEKHRFHIRKLETLLRMLDNMSVEVNQDSHAPIRRIKDDVEYYIESSQDPDFEENEYIYDDIIGLDDVELQAAGVPSGSANTTEDSTNNSIEMSPSSPTSLTSISPTNNQLITSPTIIIAAAAAAATTTTQDDDLDDKKKVIKPMPVRPTILSNPPPTAPTKISKEGNFAAIVAVKSQNSENGTSSGGSISSTSSSSNLLLSVQTPSSTISNNINTSINNNCNNSSSGVVSGSTPSNAIPSSHSGVIGSSLTAQQQQHLQQQAAAAQQQSLNVVVGLGILSQASGPPSCLSLLDNHHPTTNNHQSSTNNCVSPLSSTASSRASPPLPPSTPMTVTSILLSNRKTPSPLINGPVNKESMMSTLKTIAQQAIDRAGLEQQPPSEPQQPTVTPQQQLVVTSTPAQIQFVGGDNINHLNKTNEAHVPPLLGVAPLGPVPLQKEHQCQFQMMEAAYYHMPQPAESEKIRQYIPRNHCPTPNYYQQSPLPHSDTVEFYQRLSTETLFFVFYYMEGTKAQYLAAKALKKQSWRFHTKYMMWFQRHEEPKIINEEYEQGTYIYFDYEKWGQRKKEGFTFEYKFLEDRDLN